MCTVLIKYQNNGNVKAPVLRISDSEKLVEFYVAVTTQVLERKSFFLDSKYKKLLV